MSDAQVNQRGPFKDPMTFKKENMSQFNQKFTNPFYGDSLTDSEKFKTEQTPGVLPEHMQTQSGHRISFNQH